MKNTARIALVITGAVTALLATALGRGSFALVFGVFLIVLGARRPYGPTGTAPIGGAAPAAA
jgi:hypothetical protein